MFTMIDSKMESVPCIVVILVYYKAEYLQASGMSELVMDEIL